MSNLKEISQKSWEVEPLPLQKLKGGCDPHPPPPLASLTPKRNKLRLTTITLFKANINKIYSN